MKFIILYLSIIYSVAAYTKPYPFTQLHTLKGYVDQCLDTDRGFAEDGSDCYICPYYDGWKGGGIRNLNNQQICDLSDAYFITDWNVSQVTDFYMLFWGKFKFNQDLNWDTGRATTLAYMFQGAYEFNGNITSWDTSSVTSMASTFSMANKFNQDISSWDVSQVTHFTSTFNQALAFDQDLNSWDIGSATDMKYMFRNSDMTQTITWDTSNADTTDWLSGTTATHDPSLATTATSPSTAPSPSILNSNTDICSDILTKTTSLTETDMHDYIDNDCCTC